MYKVASILSIALFLCTPQLSASLTLEEAIVKLKTDNLEIKTASLDIKVAQKR